MNRYVRRRINNQREQWDKIAGGGWYKAYRLARRKAWWRTKPKHFNESMRYKK